MLDSVAIDTEIFDMIPNNIVRAFFVLHYKWGLSFKEISEAFNIEEDIIKQRTQTAMQAIKEAYSNE